jgi:hypothetical protein
MMVTRAGGLQDFFKALGRFSRLGSHDHRKGGSLAPLLPRRSLVAIGGLHVAPDEHGMVVAHRGADDVFYPRSPTSFTGKPIVLGDPDELVTGDNIRGRSVGHGMSEGKTV